MMDWHTIDENLSSNSPKVDYVSKLADMLAQYGQVIEQAKAAVNAFSGLDHSFHKARMQALEAGNHPADVPECLRKGRADKMENVEYLEQLIAIRQFLTEKLESATIAIGAQVIH